MVILHKLISDLQALFIDAHCKVCNRPLIDGEVAICNDCLAKLRLFNVNHLTTPHSFLDYKLEHVGRIHGASSLMIYKKGGVSQTLIHNFKYHGCHSYAKLFGKVMANKIMSNPVYDSLDYIVPVPLHKIKQRRRGYNQSAEVAHEVSSITGIPVSCDNLIRFRNTPSQASSNTADRLAFRYAFTVKNPELFNNKRILLIDDVFTSGSTIIDCCRALDAVPNLEILIYTLAFAEN